jgi:hypothetical protein
MLKEHFPVFLGRMISSQEQIVIKNSMPRGPWPRFPLIKFRRESSFFKEWIMDPFYGPNQILQIKWCLYFHIVYILPLHLKF